MGRYYSEAWFNMPLKSRVSLAESKLRIAKYMLEETRASLRNSELYSPANSYRPLQGGSPGISFIDEITKKGAYQDYLRAFMTYMIAKVECDRLRAELGKPQYARSPKRPSLKPLGTPEGKQRGPLGITATIPPKPDKQIETPTLTVKPNRKSIKETLLEVEREMFKDSDTPRLRSLLKALNEAADKMAKTSIDKMKKNPSEKNLQIALSDVATVQGLGSDNNDCLTEEIMQIAFDFTEELTDKAKKEFRRVPTVENLKKVLAKSAQHLFVGGSLNNPLKNIKRRLPPGKYAVQKDDTLSSISEKYYGSQGYWDIIYLANPGVIGNNPNLIEPGIILQIP